VEPVIDAAAGRVREVLAQQKQQIHNRQRSFDTDRNERRAEGTLQSESANADEEDDDGDDIIVAKMVGTSSAPVKEKHFSCSIF